MKKVSLDFMKTQSGHEEWRVCGNEILTKGECKIVLAKCPLGIFKSDGILILLERIGFVDEDILDFGWVVYLVLLEGGYYIYQTFPSTTSLLNTWNIEHEFRRVLIEKAGCL